MAGQFLAACVYLLCNWPETQVTHCTKLNTSDDRLMRHLVLSGESYLSSSDIFRLFTGPLQRRPERLGPLALSFPHSAMIWKLCAKGTWRWERYKRDSFIAGNSAVIPH